MYGFFFDIKKCIGCQACEAACAQKNNFFSGYRKVTKYYTELNGRNIPYFFSMTCNHCENPECFRVCPEGLYSKRRDGIVIHQFGKCNGCIECVKTCPYQAPKYNYVIGKVSKCNLCKDLLEKNMEPKCVKACVTGALQLKKIPPLSVKKLKHIFNIEALCRAYITQPSLEIVVPEFLINKGEEKSE